MREQVDRVGSFGHVVVLCVSEGGRERDREGGELGGGGGRGKMRERRGEGEGEGEGGCSVQVSEWLCSRGCLGGVCWAGLVLVFVIVDGYLCCVAGVGGDDTSKATSYERKHRERSMLLPRPFCC